MRHLSIHKDHEAEKEAVAVNVIYACEPEIAERLVSEMLVEVEDDRA